MKLLKIFVGFVLFCVYSCEVKEDKIVNYLSRNIALQGKSDIVFLLDRSGSVGATHFEEEKGFVESFLTHIVVDANATRVAVISYSDTVERHIDYLQNPKTKCFLSQELQYVVFKDSGATNIAAALKEANEVFKNARPHINKVLVLISDGYATRGGNPAPYAQHLKDSGVEIFCFGIGRFLEGELKKLASSDEHVYSCTGFREFKRLARKIRGDPHEVSWSGQAGKPNCDHLCDSPYKGEAMDLGCCDHHAKCSCALRSGMHTCVCGPGYYGLSGLMGTCKACPKGTYKNTLEPARSCTLCPPGSTTNTLASTSIHDCVCKEGYEGEPSKGTGCTIIKCPVLQAPTNGYILGICENSFGSECLFMCEDGYELLNRNDDIRKCQSDGTWSGRMATCSIIRCPTLPVPTYGRKLCESGKNLITGTKCSFKCFHGFNLHGTEVRECLLSKRWSGTSVSCNPIACDAPPPIAHGRILNCPHTEKPTFQKACFYQCHTGFVLRGPHYLVCRENGKFLDANKRESKPFCEDVTPPEIKCQHKIWVSAAKGRNGSMVGWTTPFVEDNSGITPKLFTTPIGITSPSYFTIGQHFVQYTAVDHFNLKSQCSVVITITDDEPPSVLYCPENIEVTTYNLQEVVEWDEPWFEDNSGQPLTIYKFVKSGDKFAIGRHTISYGAVDQSNNEAWCTFDITVKRTTCPYYPPPANGAFTCNDWLHGKFCQTYCNSKHDFVEKPAQWYICNAQSKWQTVPPNYPTPWPDCARLTLPDRLRLMLKGFYYHGSCNNEAVQHEIKKLFLMHLSTLDAAEFCVIKGTCSVETVKVHCGKETMWGRRKRNVWDYAQREELELEFDITIKIDQELNDTDTVMQNFLETIKNLKWELDEELISQATTTAPLWGASGSVLNSTQTGKVVFTQDKAVLICKPGSVVRDNICVACAPGTYFQSSTQECKDCPLGQYQESDGQLECISCPDGTTTLYRRSRNETDCKGICKPGTFSSTGLETCIACPIGTYQEHDGQKACETCPNAKSTSSIQSTSFNDCQDFCKVGSFSETGLTPCSPCVESYYQPEAGKRNCIECPNNFSTTYKGAQAISECLDLDPCASDVCLNEGNCNRIGRGAECVCKKGYEGLRCERDVDECEQNPCFNEGFCVNVDGSFYCNCTSGFFGLYCETEIDECISSPCLNGGTCLDKINTYECSCTAGYEGLNCENKLEFCYHDIICLNGGKCKIEENGTFCECESGYTGIDCSVDIDDCLNVTCHNNGSCRDGLSAFSCTCIEGFTGSLCEININECKGNQCSQGSTCQDLIAAYKCLCPPGYSGTYCENKLDDNFILNFPEDTATIANRATMTLQSPLSDMTVSMWIQTTDTDHSGTPLSYAVASTSTWNGTKAVIDNALTISDCSGIQIYVNNEPLVTDVQLTDGQWHHLAFTWSSENSGEWNLYKDGELHSQGNQLQANNIINEGGSLIIGQEQDDLGGGFSPMETFTGNITRVNIWNTTFSRSNITRLCNMDDDIPGKVIAWPDFLQGLKGDIKLIKNEKPF